MKKRTTERLCIGRGCRTLASLRKIKLTRQVNPKLRVRVDEVTLTRRKCAKSIYELSTRPDKGALLVDNGVLEALAVLSGVRKHVPYFRKCTL